MVDIKVCRVSGAHNLFPCEWGLVICNSKQSSLYEVSSGETIWRSNEEARITRGLAASDDYIFVGCSMHSERRERYWKTGGIWIIDRKTLKTMGKLPLPGSGDVHEIRLIGIPDECHNDQVITLDNLICINKVSSFINLAFKLRKTSPLFQRDLFPISPLIRTFQMTARWKRSIKQVYARKQHYR